MDKVINLLDRVIYESLLSEPSPPTPGDCLLHEFYDEDDDTLNILYQINGLKLEEALRQKTVLCKQQNHSQAHPKWGPFRLICSDNQADVNSINKKERRH